MIDPTIIPAVTATTRAAAQAVALRFVRIFVYVFAGGEREYRAQVCSPFIASGELRTIWTDLGEYGDPTAAEEELALASEMFEELLGYDVVRMREKTVNGCFKIEDAGNRDGRIWRT